MRWLDGIQGSMSQRPKAKGKDKAIAPKQLAAPLLTALFAIGVFALLSFEGINPASEVLATQAPPHPLVRLAIADGALSGLLLDMVAVNPKTEDCVFDPTQQSIFEKNQVRCTVLVERVWEASCPDTISFIAQVDVTKPSTMVVGETCLVFYFRQDGGQILPRALHLGQIETSVRGLDLIPSGLDPAATDSLSVGALFQEFISGDPSKRKEIARQMLSVDRWHDKTISPLS